jgi:hypothetical protein
VASCEKALTPAVACAMRIRNDGARKRIAYSRPDGVDDGEHKKRRFPLTHIASMAVKGLRRNIILTHTHKFIIIKDRILHKMYDAIFFI